MTGTDGTKQTTRQGIADTFADFYAQLYASDARCTSPAVDSEPQQITPFTTKELKMAISQLKGGKAPDTTGIRSEMLRQPGPELENALLQLYNTIIQPNAPTPANWRKTVITVIPKAGDLTNPQNYRPI
eukprot:7404758-Pyramimonas_sp.AAC.1